MDLNLSEPCVAEPALETATLPFALFDLEHAREPGFVADLLGLRQQAVEVQALEARPQRLQATGSSRSGSASGFREAFMGVLAGQLFVVGEVVRAHGECAHARIIGQMHRDRRACAAPGAMLIDEVAHGGQVRGVLGERGGQRRLQSRGAVGIEQIDQAARERAQMHAALRRGGEELRAARRRVVQPIHRPVRAAGALLIDQVLDMRGILDLLRRDRSCADAWR